MRIDRLAGNVLEWAEDRGIFMESTPEDQAIKTLEELSELFKALSNNDKEGTIDAYGDVLVTLIVGMELAGTCTGDCLDHAWKEIRDRKGKMVNGLFVKDE